MPRDGSRGERVTASLHTLSQDGRSWIAAEAALAQAEVAADGKRLVLIVTLVAVVFGCLFASVILLSAYVVSLLAPYVNGLANAAGILGFLLLVLAAIMGWRIRALTSTEFGLITVLKRWWSTVAKTSEAVR
jgi:uncharacterized membrane protein (DUF485 family)